MTSNNYRAIHYRVQRERGAACEYECVDCKGHAEHWSWIHDTDPANVANYTPRCASCHSRYDLESHARLTWNDVCEIRRIAKLPRGRGKRTMRQLSERYGVSRSEISLILSGKRWREKLDNSEKP